MHRFFLALSKFMAFLGGLVLTVLILLICFSIFGRTLSGFFHSDFAAGLLGGFAQTMINVGIGPVNGDYELVEAGIAFTIFAFLPLTQITGAHANVDIFTNGLPVRAQLYLKAIIEILFAAVLVMIAVQLNQGMWDKMNRGQTTFLLQFPVWWAYGLSLIGAVSAALVGVYVAYARIHHALTGQAVIIDEGADH